jgi:hypothetical protein
MQCGTNIARCDLPDVCHQRTHTHAHNQHSWLPLPAQPGRAAVFTTDWGVDSVTAPLGLTVPATHAQTHAAAAAGAAAGDVAHSATCMQALALLRGCAQGAWVGHRVQHGSQIGCWAPSMSTKQHRSLPTRTAAYQAAETTVHTA